MIKCKACGNDMDMEFVEGTEELEILCVECKRKAAAAYDLNDWDFEGLYWSRNETPSLVNLGEGPGIVLNCRHVTP